ncbi:GNAT family N-acetyltransferase [Rhizobium mayense]|uniref:GNAT family N-acetyltransferase n=1 Tax=Rhizobium mayense TaxID=1312184 RepID=UPI003D80A87F
MAALRCRKNSIVSTYPIIWTGKRGHGYATELVKDALPFSFNDLHADLVTGLVRSASVAPRHVLEKYGFTFEREIMLHGTPSNLFAVVPYSQTV